jgi:hypothetical protein
MPQDATAGGSTWHGGMQRPHGQHTPICSSKLDCQGWSKGSSAMLLSTVRPTVDEAANVPIMKQPSMLGGRSLK